MDARETSPQSAGTNDLAVQQTRKSICVKIVLLGAALGVGPTALAAGAANGGGVTASGSAEIWAKPDRATIELGMETQSKRLDKARDHINQVASRVLKLTDSLGIPRKRVNSAQPAIDPQYHYNQKTHERKLTGYRVSRRITVRLRQLDRLGNLIQRAADAGVNRLSPPALTSSREKRLKRQALAAAARDARANARAMARALHARLQAVESINSSGANLQPPPRPYSLSKASANRASGPNYQTGQIRVRAKVTASFSLRGTVTR